jgi:hypothetical protein
LNNLTRFAIFLHLHCLREPVAPHRPSDASKGGTKVQHRETFSIISTFYNQVLQLSGLLHFWKGPELKSEPASLAYVVFSGIQTKFLCSTSDYAIIAFYHIFFHYIVH